MTRSIVVTGLGAVTPLGEDFPISWKALIAGQDAQAPLDLFNTSGCRCHHAASASLPPLPELSAQAIRRLPRASRLAIPAAREALASAGLLDAEGRSTLPELPLSVSTTAGGMAFGEDFLRRVLARNRPNGGAHLFSQVSRYLPQQQVLDMQLALGFAGHSVIIANACASGANAIGHAADLIAAGAADCVLAGGFEALTELVFAGFDCLQATSLDRCRPFDLNRSGLLLGEAAAFLVLESGEHAQRRGATPLCRLTGYGHTTDFFHLTQPQPDGAALVEVMRAAAVQAGVTPAQIGYINAHGTATPVNDGVEAKAYLAFLGDALGSTRISSTKAAIGHTLGAAGSVEALFAVQALRTGHLPPQLNLQTPIPEIATALVGEKESSSDMRHVMSVNLGFGGSNAALIFSQESFTMKIDLAVIGQGAVSPAGVGVDALLHRDPVPVSVAALGRPDEPWPVLRVDLTDPAFARWQREPRLRRASSMTFFLVEAAEQALAGVSSADRAETGIIVAFSAGCIAYSRRFFEGIVTQGTASPALFPETVFNSPASHVATVLGLNGAAYALVGDETAWVAALQTASVWLQKERVRQVLVLGAEEFDPIVLDAYRSACWLRRSNSANGFLTSEGAAGILVHRAGPGDARRITIARDGLIYRTKKEAAAAAERLLSESDPALPCHRSARHNWLGSLEKKATGDRPPLPVTDSPYLGEAFTASAAWHTVRALACLDPRLPRLLVPVWGLNHQFGLLELENRK